MMPLIKFPVLPLVLLLQMVPAVYAGRPRLVNTIPIPLPPDAECAADLTGMGLDAVGNLYVANQNQVLKFSPSGALLQALSTLGSGGEGKFSRAHDVAVDASGDIYITDTADDKVIKFSAAGQFIAEWGRFGTGPLEFRDPMAISIAPGGNLYVTDFYNDRIQILSASGQYLDSITLNARPGGTAITDNLVWTMKVAPFDDYFFTAAIPPAEAPGAASGYYNLFDDVTDCAHSSGVFYLLRRGHLHTSNPAGVNDAYARSGMPLSDLGMSPGGWAQSIAVSRTGRIYVSDSQFCRVLVFEFERPYGDADPWFKFPPPKTVFALAGQTVTLTPDIGSTQPLTYDWCDFAFYTNPLPPFDSGEACFTIPNTNTPSYTLTAPAAPGLSIRKGVTASSLCGSVSHTYKVVAVASLAPVVIREARVNSDRTQVVLTAGRSDGAAMGLEEVASLKLEVSADMQHWFPSAVAGLSAGNSAVFNDVIVQGRTKYFYRVRY